MTSHSGSSSLHGHGPAPKPGNSSIEKPVPYLVASGVLRAYVTGAEPKIAVCEALLTGALDETSAGRAWIASAGDVVVEGAMDSTSASASPLASSESVSALGQVQKQQVARKPVPSSWSGDKLGLEVDSSRTMQEYGHAKLKKRPSVIDKGKSKETPTGLPTPPESSGSSEGGDDDSEESAEAPLSASSVPLPSAANNAYIPSASSIPKGAKSGEGVYDPNLNVQLMLDVQPGAERGSGRRRVSSMFGGKEKLDSRVGGHYVPARLQQQQQHKQQVEGGKEKKRWWAW